MLEVYCNLGFALRAGMQTVQPSTVSSQSYHLRDLLLRATLQHARDTNDYYREHFAELDVDRTGLEALTAIPLLSKEDLTAYYDRICRPSRFPQLIMYTSGTEGTELMVPVSEEEIAAAKYLLEGILSFRTGDLPLSMSLARVGHGTQLFLQDVPTIPAHVNFGPDQVLALLKREYTFPGVAPRISVLEGNLLTHMKLIEMLHVQGIDGRRLGIELVLTTGWYVTPRKRRAIEQFWGAELVDRYGVTEVNGDAKQCPACGAFHFDPFVIAEVLDPTTGATISRGVGAIVLTGLFPLNQVAPKIRYQVGDLVSVDPEPACGLDEPAYRFLGRAKQCMFLPTAEGTRYLLFATEVADALDEYPQTVRRNDTGFLCFVNELLPGEHPLVRTRVEWQGPGDASEIAAAIRNCSPSIASAVADGICGFEVELVAPGALETIAKL